MKSSKSKNTVMPSGNMTGSIGSSASEYSTSKHTWSSSEYSMAEVVIPEKWVGRSLSELKIREQYGINVVGIIQGVQVDVTLDPYEPLPEGAILILIGATSVLEKFHTWK